MNEITIIVAGKAAVGKSTMIMHLEDVLKANGFDVELQFDTPDYGGEEAYYFRLKHGESPEQVDRIKANTKIILKEMMMKNAPTENPKYQTQTNINS